jgi:hypothetical protein
VPRKRKSDVTRRAKRTINRTVNAGVMNILSTRKKTEKPDEMN